MCTTGVWGCGGVSDEGGWEEWRRDVYEWSVGVEVCWMREDGDVYKGSVGMREDRGVYKGSGG